MSKIAIKVLAAILAAAICLPFSMFLAGDGMSKETAPAQINAEAEKFAAPAQQTPAEYLLVEKLPNTVTAALAKVQADTATPAEQAPVLQKIMPVSDKDPVTMLAFGSEFLAAYLTGLNNLTSRLLDTGGELPEFIFEYDDNAGAHHVIYLGMYYDEANQLIIGRDQQGAFAMGFDVDLKQKMMYSSYNGWERNAGFCRLYDLLTPAIGIYYDTKRIKFEYGGRDWMVQIWKGLYFIVGSGAEIGLYSKSQSRIPEFYDCVRDDDMLEMSMRLLKDDKVLLERAPQKHWWLNGVVLSTGLYLPASLTFEGSILFEDEAMKAAFLAAFEKLCAQEGITFTVEGGLVRFVW